METMTTEKNETINREMKHKEINVKSLKIVTVHSRCISAPNLTYQNSKQLLLNCVVKY